MKLQSRATGIIRSFLLADAATRHALEKEVSGFYMVDESQYSDYYDLIESVKIRVEILLPIIRGKDVSRWLVHSKRRKIMQIIDKNPYYEQARERVEQLIEEAKESL